VTPTNGTELETSFLFSASKWIDVNLPLTYQFGFVSPGIGSLLTVPGATENAYATSTLPAGAAPSNSLV
jgi:hypothetical protein